MDIVYRVKYDYYVLERNNNITVVCVSAGDDPLHGMASWSVCAGPFETDEEAEGAGGLASNGDAGDDGHE